MSVTRTAQASAAGQAAMEMRRKSNSTPRGGSVESHLSQVPVKKKKQTKKNIFFQYVYSFGAGQDSLKLWV